MQCICMSSRREEHFIKDVVKWPHLLSEMLWGFHHNGFVRIGLVLFFSQADQRNLASLCALRRFRWYICVAPPPVRAHSLIVNMPTCHMTINCPCHLASKLKLEQGKKGTGGHLPCTFFWKVIPG